MKYIFDFDDVLFNTKQFKQHIFLCLEKHAIPQDKARQYYQTVRGGEFSLRKFISDLFAQEKITNISAGDMYNEIMQSCQTFINQELLDVIRGLGKENCYLVTYGEEEFQAEKIQHSGMGPLFSEIKIVPGSKKEAVREIYNAHKGDQMLFIDDNPHDDITEAEFPGLKKILYKENGLEILNAELRKHSDLMFLKTEIKIT